MTTKAEYLKRYMSPSEETIKKKRKKKKANAAIAKHSGLKLVDEDIGAGLSAPAQPTSDDDTPTIAEVVDERPELVRRMEEYTSSNKWISLAADNSPPRKRPDTDNSPPRRRPDTDNSPPRRQPDTDNSPPRRRPDTDNSPPRRRPDTDNSPPRRRPDTDNFPPRRRPDTDNSPPRRRPDTDNSPPRRRPDTDNSKMQQTLSGKVAGLSSAQDMKAEAEKLKKKESQMFSKVSDGMLGKDAETVFRDKATGRQRDINQEERVKSAKAGHIKEQYDTWGKGLAQVEADKVKTADMLHEFSKPLARAKDDADLDAYLKSQDREGDPMLKFTKKKDKSRHGSAKYPVYKGPAPAPNRFHIQPGYRWDGVDRSNGFEKKYFQTVSNRKAVASDAYKWSTEDM